MRLTGIQKNRTINKWDDIFTHDEMGLLSSVRPNIKTPTADDKLLQKYSEIAAFYQREKRLPQKDYHDANEKRLARAWDAITKNQTFSEAIRAHDSLGLLEMQICPDKAAQTIQSLQDIFSNDEMDLLNSGHMEIFKLEHVPRRVADGKVYADEENAERKSCTDFWRFEALFKKVHQLLKEGRAHLSRLKTETYLDPGALFLLQGSLCYIADYAETEERKSTRPNNRRLRVIYENGTESNLLTRSLARAVYKDENGRRISINDTKIMPVFSQTLPTERLVTGQIYVVKLRHPKRELTAYRNLCKIGYTTDTVEKRIANAENDSAFLESRVEPVLLFECRNINPHTFEQLLHAFFAAQRLNIRLLGKDGSIYTPHEWFDVDLDVIREAIVYIQNGTIKQYRMNNTTGKIVAKQNYSAP